MEHPALLRTIFSIPFRQFSLEEYRSFCVRAWKESVCTLHTVNPEMLVDARAHADFAHILASATACVPMALGLRMHACAFW
jgi:UDP-N-acetyl-D-mannosaminuronic acid transferase (WecB/TagA/CpsF family)